MQRMNSDAGKDGAETVPERCSKAEFAALLRLHPSAVTRYKQAGRIVLDRSGRVAVRESLARLAATWDPVRGGRKGGGINAPDGGTLARIETLLAKAPAVGAQSEAAKLRDELAAMRKELVEAQRIATWYLGARESGDVLLEEELHDRSAALSEALRERFPEAMDAYAAGGEALEAFVDELMAVALWGWTAEVAREYVAEVYGVSG